MFNGDRLTFIRGYKLKHDSDQGELPLDESDVKSPALLAKG
jgi:hypothetical protein